LQEIFAIDFLQALDVAESGLLCFVQIFDDSTGGGYQGTVIIADAETFKCGSSKVF
jgi:hypothetical protein